MYKFQTYPVYNFSKIISGGNVFPRVIDIPSFINTINIISKINSSYFVWISSTFVTFLSITLYVKIVKVWRIYPSHFKPLSSKMLSYLYITFSISIINIWHIIYPPNFVSILSSVFVKCIHYTLYRYRQQTKTNVWEIESSAQTVNCA